MISSIRRKIKTKGTQVIIWIALFSLVGVSSIPNLLKRFFGETDWIIDVDGTKVSREEFANKVEEQKKYLEYFKQQFGPMALNLFTSAGLSINPKDLAIQALTGEILFNKLGKQINLQFDPDFIKQELYKKLPPQLLEGATDLQSLSYMLGYPNAQALQQSVENGLRQTFLIDLAAGSIYVPEFELKNSYNSTHARKKFSVLVFPFDKYLKEVKKTILSKDELKKFFDEQNQKEKKYLIPEKRSGIKWEFSPASYGIKVNEKEIESYYNKNKRSEFLENPVRVQVRRILLKFKDAKDKAEVMKNAQKLYSELVNDKTKFADFAKKYSQDKESASKGGLMEAFAKGQKNPIFEKAAFNLKNDNDISPVFESDEGIEIIQRISKKPLTFKKLDEVKSKIRETLEKEKFNKLFSIDMKRFINESKESKDFNEFAKKKGAKENNINLMKNDNSLLAQKLFGIKSENGLSSYFENGKGYAVRLNKIEKSYIPTLDSVLKNVEEDLYRYKATLRLREQLKKAKNLKKSFEDLKKEFDIELKTTPLINKNSNEAEKLLKDGIPVNLMFGLNKVGSILDAYENQSGFLIKLEQVEEFNKAKFDEKKEALRQEVFRKRKQELEASLIASLKKNVKIKNNEKILQQFKNIR